MKQEQKYKIEMEKQYLNSEEISLLSILKSGNTELLEDNLFY